MTGQQARWSSHGYAIWQGCYLVRQPVCCPVLTPWTLRVHQCITTVCPGRLFTVSSLAHFLSAELRPVFLELYSAGLQSGRPRLADGLLVTCIDMSAPATNIGSANASIRMRVCWSSATHVQIDQLLHGVHHGLHMQVPG
jgi:hypothetical protein